MIDMVRLIDALAFTVTIILFFAMLWIVIYTSVSMAIKNYWPEDDTTEKEQKKVE